MTDTQASTNVHLAEKRRQLGAAASRRPERTPILRPELRLLFEEEFHGSEEALEYLATH